MRKLLAGMIVGSLFVALPTLCSGDDARPVDKLMRKKLEHSQKVLEAVVLNDFASVIKNSEELIAISKLAEWKSINTAKYEVFSNEFRRTAQTMIDEAKNKNLDGVTLAYVDLTLNCVKCHKHVREVRMTRLERSEAVAANTRK